MFFFSSPNLISFTSHSFAAAAVVTMVTITKNTTVENLQAVAVMAVVIKI